MLAHFKVILIHSNQLYIWIIQLRTCSSFVQTHRCCWQCVSVWDIFPQWIVLNGLWSQSDISLRWLETYTLTQIPTNHSYLWVYQARSKHLVGWQHYSLCDLDLLLFWTFELFQMYLIFSEGFPFWCKRYSWRKRERERDHWSMCVCSCVRSACSLDIGY